MKFSLWSERVSQSVGMREIPIADTPGTDHPIYDKVHT